MAPTTRSMTRAILACPFTLHPNALRKLGVVVPEPEPVLVPQWVLPETPCLPDADYSPYDDYWSDAEYSTTSHYDYSPTSPQLE